MATQAERVSKLTAQQRALLELWLRKDAGPGLYGDAVPQKKLLAYVVPDYNASDVDNGQDRDAGETQIAEWHQVYDSIYSTGDRAFDPEFNTSGWSSTYTGEPIPDNEMREWLDHTVRRILELRPKRILEIGCGTGLLLFRIAPKVERYFGIDFSEAALAYVRSHLTIPTVTLERRFAHELHGIEADAFDLVILNSVVQYFPCLDYFIRVVTQAADLLRPGGHIFVGDVRNLALLEAFHASVELSRCEEDLPAVQLRDRVRRKVESEKELFLDPRLFPALSSRIPHITAIEVQPKRGHARNELSAFRYDAVLQVQGSASTHEGIRHQRVVRRNARVADAVELTRVLRSEQLTGTVSDLRPVLAQRSGPASFPENLAERGSDVRLRWSDAPDLFEAILIEDSAGPLLESVCSSSADDLAVYANDPLRASRMQRLVPVLRSYLQQHLPDYMVPSDFVTLEAFPLSANGKVDRNALPMPSAAPARSASDHAAPTNPVEQVVMKMWGDILGIENLGIHDNFFDMGGHSLLATKLISRIRHTFHVELPLRSLFERPTVAHQATEIEELLLLEIENLPEDKARGLMAGQR